MKINIKIGDLELTASLDGSPTAAGIYDQLPVKAAFSAWGDEIYFSLPEGVPEGELLEVVGLGDLAYWGPGRAFCIFWGCTPASVGDEIRPAGGVTVFGKLDGDPLVMNGISGSNILITKDGPNL
jgi:uncharacterized protein